MASPTKPAHAESDARLPEPCGGRCSPMRALAVPTLLLLIVALMIAKVAFFDATPTPSVPLRPAEAVAVAASAAPTPTATATATAIPSPTGPAMHAVPTRAPLVEPPICATPQPSHVCRTGLPSCPDVLTTPGVLCRWPHEPADTGPAHTRG